MMNLNFELMDAKILVYYTMNIAYRVFNWIKCQVHSSISSGVSFSITLIGYCGEIQTNVVIHQLLEIFTIYSHVA